MRKRRMKTRERVPDISVCVPVYNAQPYLAACLDSVLGQSLRAIEIICANDASTDGSAAILADYAAREPRLRVLTAAENRGLPGARNLALSAARGRYIYFFDADDILPPDALETLLSVADADRLDGLLFETTPVFENEALRARYGNDRCYRRRHRYEGIFTGPKLYIETLTHGDYIPMVWLQLWRADFLRAWDLRFCEDLDRLDTQEDDIFYYRALLRARRVRCLHESHHFYRRREGSATTGGRGVSLHARVVVYCERVRALGDAGPSLPKELRDVYEAYMFADYRELRRLYHALGDIGIDAFRNPAHRLFYRALRHNESAWRVCRALLPGLAEKRPVFFVDRANAAAVIRAFGLAPDACVILETEAHEIRLQDLAAALRPGALHLFFTWGYEAMRDFLRQKGLREGEDFQDGRALLLLLTD